MHTGRISEPVAQRGGWPLLSEAQPVNGHPGPPSMRDMIACAATNNVLSLIPSVPRFASAANELHIGYRVRLVRRSRTTAMPSTF